jgi:hypothetical protein
MRRRLPAGQLKEAAMKRIRISEATYRMIAEAAVLPFRSTGQRQPDGTWLVPVQDDTYERLQQHRQPGETEDDAITGIIHTVPAQPIGLPELDLLGERD